MSNKVRFSFCMLLKRSFWRNFNLRRLLKPIEPGLQLSEKALETPLPPGPLSDLRDFLARRGSWKNHPIDSVETFMAIPAVGVSIEQPVPSVIGIAKPVFTSLGFCKELKHNLKESILLFYLSHKRQQASEQLMHRIECWTSEHMPATSYPSPRTGG